MTPYSFLREPFPTFRLSTFSRMSGHRMHVLTKDNRFKDLNQEQVNAYVEEMLRDLLRAYKEDTM